MLCSARYFIFLQIFLTPGNQFYKKGLSSPCTLQKATRETVIVPFRFVLMNTAF